MLKLNTRQGDLSNKKKLAPIDLPWAFLEKRRAIELYPSKNSFCPCGSFKKYKHCCQKEETHPFSPLEKNLQIVSDKGLFVLEDQEETKLLQDWAENLNHGTYSSKAFERLKEKYPNKPIILFSEGLKYFLTRDFLSSQKLFQGLKDSHFRPLNLLRWWFIFEWSNTTPFPLKNLSTLKEVADKEAFFLTEFSIWGLIQIWNALNKGRFIEAEAHFISLARISAKLGVPNHWSINEGISILDSAYFVRRLKI